MQPSIFTKIINGEVPCHKIYEDDHTLAFLDINPITPGHTLVIPKKQIEFIWDLNEEDYQHLCKTAKLIARHLRKTLGVPYIGQQIIGVDVPHAHIHLVPFCSVDEYRNWPEPGEPNHEALSQLAKKLKLNR